MAAPWFHPSILPTAESLPVSQESPKIRGTKTSAFLVDSTSILEPNRFSQGKSFTSFMEEASTLHGDQSSTLPDESTSTLVPSVLSQPSDGAKPGLSISHLDPFTPHARSSTEALPGLREAAGINVEEGADCRRPACYGDPPCHRNLGATSSDYEPEEYKQKAEDTLSRLVELGANLRGVTAERKRMRLADESENDTDLYLAWCFQHPEDAPGNKSMRGINQAKGKKQAQRSTVRQYVEDEFGAVSESTKPGPKVVDEQKRLFPTANALFSAASTRKVDLDQEGPFGEIWVIEAPLPWGCVTWEEAQGRVEDKSRGLWSRNSLTQSKAGSRTKKPGGPRKSESFRHRLGSKCRSLIPRKRVKSTATEQKGSRDESSSVST